MTELQAQRQRCADFFSGLDKALEVLKDAGDLGVDPHITLLNFVDRMKFEYEASKVKEETGPIIVGNICINVTNLLRTITTDTLKI